MPNSFPVRRRFLARRTPLLRTPLRRKAKPTSGSQKGLKRSSAGSKKKPSKKLNQSGLMRVYGLDPSRQKSMRYKGLKGIYWTWLARYIRMRDQIQYGACISCGRRTTYEELQAGHFAPAGSCGFDLLFDERNLNGECAGCNGFNSMHLLGYARNLDKRYGTGTSEALQDRYDKRHRASHITKEWNAREYAQKIPEIRAKLAALQA